MTESVLSVACANETYVPGSHEFYLGYAVQNGKLLCLDAGHFHPTEAIADKISSGLMWLDEILLHVSRGVRWDSDHVVILTDELQAIAQELVRGHFLERVHIGLDFFDASINRVAAWVIGTRCMIKALLIALLEPTERLRNCEAEGNFTARLALQEECKTLPFGAVWDYYCAQSGVPVGPAWLDEIARYRAAGGKAGGCEDLAGEPDPDASGREEAGGGGDHPEKVHRYERAYGSFERTFTLPGTVNPEQIQATYADGLLTIVLPKAEQAKPREIPVKVG